jgi:hypothetical protein
MVSNTADALKNLSRGTLVQILNSALSHKKNVFGRQASLKWLGIYPGDLGVKLLLAKFYHAENNTQQAVALVKELVETDPEFLEAYEFYAELPVTGAEKEFCHACRFALGGRGVQKNLLPAWSPALHAVQKSIDQDKVDSALQMIFRILSLKQDNSLINVYHLKTIYQSQDTNTVQKLAELYGKNWPKTIQFKMVLAEELLEMGEEERAVNLLHECVSKDATGQVARRWWGNQHVFLPLWPDKLEINLDMQIPNEVAFDLGWNLLPEGDPQEVNGMSYDEFELNATRSHRKSFIRSETGKEVSKEFSKIARRLRKDVDTKIDGRFPVYVILTTKTGLVKQYGENTYKVIVQLLRQIQLLIQSKPGWDSAVFIPDDVEFAGKYGTSLLSVLDPWKIKNSIQELDAALMKKGEKIGSLLIVGTDEVVPFHKLPNPTDDVDDEILSDNPYSNLDSNYFVPDWCVGRIIGERGSDAGLLIQQLRGIVKFHSQPKSMRMIWERILQSFSALRTYTNLSSIGYSASVWKESAYAAFKPIGEAKKVFISPALKNHYLKQSDLVSNDLAYFNLHGMLDRGEWYGQRNYLDPAGVDYPVAMAPEDLVSTGKNPKIIFTEACYGGHLFNKVESESIGLKYLSLGVPVFIGSTTTAYGSITTPLIAADLLANYFWKNIREGSTTGDAFMRAKVSLVQEMTKRQGYLDGEDQKTLIQFVYYGDPFYAYEIKDAQNKGVKIISKPSKIKTICDIEGQVNQKPEINEETLNMVKSTLKPYLPGIDQAIVKINRMQIGVDRDFRGHGATDLQLKTIKDKYVMTLQNAVVLNKSKYIHIARVTVDKNGKMIKMAISR